MDRLTSELENALTVCKRVSAETPDGVFSFRFGGDTFRREGIHQSHLRALAKRGALRQVPEFHFCRNSMARRVAQTMSAGRGMLVTGWRSFRLLWPLTGAACASYDAGASPESSNERKDDGSF